MAGVPQPLVDFTDPAFGVGFIGYPAFGLLPVALALAPFDGTSALGVLIWFIDGEPAAEESPGRTRCIPVTSGASRSRTTPAIARVPTGSRTFPAPVPGDRHATGRLSLRGFERPL